MTPLFVKTLAKKWTRIIDYWKYVYVTHLQYLNTLINFYLRPITLFHLHRETVRGKTSKAISSKTRNIISEELHLSDQKNRIAGTETNWYENTLIWTILVLLSANVMKNKLFSLQKFWYNLPFQNQNFHYKQTQIYNLNHSTVVLNVVLTFIQKHNF